jgi:predicted ester cyclase
MAGPKQLLEEFYRVVWNEGNLDAIPRYREEDCTTVGLSGEPMMGNVAFAEFVRATRARFDTFHITLDQIVVDGDDAALRCTLEATRGGVQLRVQGAAFATIKNGKFVRGWNVWDTHAIAEGLAGRAPAPLATLLAR